MWGPTLSHSFRHFFSFVAVEKKSCDRSSSSPSMEETKGHKTQMILRGGFPPEGRPYAFPSLQCHFFVQIHHCLSSVAQEKGIVFLDFALFMTSRNYTHYRVNVKLMSVNCTIRRPWAVIKFSLHHIVNA